MITSTALEAVPLQPEGQAWRSIVIGTGAGGATAGCNLARLGRPALFVERGKPVHPVQVARSCWERNGASAVARRSLGPPRLRVDADAHVRGVVFPSPARTPVRP